MQDSLEVGNACRAAIYLETQDLKKTCSSTREIAEVQTTLEKSTEKVIQYLDRSGLVNLKENRTEAVGWLDPRTDLIPGRN